MKIRHTDQIGCQPSSRAKFGDPNWSPGPNLSNEWLVEKKALVATCLKGEALEVYKSLNEDDNKVYNTVQRSCKML